MENVVVASETLPYFEYVEGETFTHKILALINGYFVQQLQACEQEIREYELRYGVTFAEFAERWENGAIPDPWSHSTERDYMEWEGLEAERRNWLLQLRNLQRQMQPSSQGVYGEG
ncbi:MAG: hypothetical protein WHX52_13410 [Anaerolineae bacterium]